MRTPDEHSLANPSKPYCKFCGAADGTLKSYEDVLANMTAFMQKTQGLDERVARDAAKAMMAKLPAWSTR